MKKPKMLVNLKTYQRRWQIEPAAIQGYIQRVWLTIVDTIKLSPSSQTEISIVFLNPKQMKKYNKEYRKKDYATDVLSFPVNEMADHSNYLGDILLCVDKAFENAKSAGHSIDHEVQVLMLHGVLHLLGYDHESDTGEMDAIEGKLRKLLIAKRSLIHQRHSTARA